MKLITKPGLSVAMATGHPVVATSKQPQADNYNTKS